MLENKMKREKNLNEIYTMSPLTWAYIGDCIYELYVRMKLVNTTNLKPHMLHVRSIEYVKARSQAKFLKMIYDKLSEEEKEIVRRGRNTQNHHLPKNVSLEDYTMATAFEGLIGFLYLTKQDDRLTEVLEMIFSSQE